MSAVKYEVRCTCGVHAHATKPDLLAQGWTGITSSMPQCVKCSADVRLQAGRRLTIQRVAGRNLCLTCGKSRSKSKKTCKCEREAA